MSEDCNDPKVLEDLFQQLKKPYFASENYMPMDWLGTALPRRMGVDPFKRPGDLLRWALLWLAIYTLLVFVPAVVVTTVTRTWATAPVFVWLMVSILWGGYGIVPKLLTRSAIGNVLALPGALATGSGFRRLIAWNRRWLRYPVFVMISVSFVLINVAVLIGIQRWLGADPIHSGSLAIGVIVLYSIGELSAVGVLLFAQGRLLSNEEFRLFRPSPSQTLAIRRSLRGYNQAVRNGSLYMTGAILLFVILLPRNFSLLAAITLSLLGLAYASVVLMVVAPRLMMSTIVRRSKECDLAPYQERLNALWSRVQQLSPAEYKEFQRLKEVHNELYNAPENLLNVGQLLAPIARAVLLPTLTSVITFLVKQALSP
jgi:hypothetical protein